MRTSALQMGGLSLTSKRVTALSSRLLNGSEDFADSRFLFGDAALEGQYLRLSRFKSFTCLLDRI